MEAGNNQCPVCLGRISPQLFNAHMTSHSKEEIVAALLRQTPVTIPQVPISIPGTTPTNSNSQNVSNITSNSTGLPQPYPGFHFMATPGDLTSSPFIGKKPEWMSFIVQCNLVNIGHWFCKISKIYRKLRKRKYRKYVKLIFNFYYVENP